MSSGDSELAARLYSGDFLPACYDDWILVEREKLRSEALEALARLAEEAAEREDHPVAIKNAQRILDLEPTDETAVRLQLEAHLALGDRTAALRSYHRYAEVLEREFGTAPGDAVRTMYQQIRAGAFDNDVQLRDPVLFSESPFVGREFEWSAEHS